MSEWADLVRSRRSVRDFSPRSIPEALLREVLEDARWAASWCNTAPYHVCIAQGATRDAIAASLLELYDGAAEAQRGGLLGKLRLWLGGGAPDGDFNTVLAYPDHLNARRRECGYGLYTLLGIGREDGAARQQQVRRNFEFFGAPTVIFLFAYDGMGPFASLDAGCYLQTLLLAAHARGLGACAQGSVATWASPIRAAFPDVPPRYKLLCGVAIGYASDAAIKQAPALTRSRPPVLTRARSRSDYTPSRGPTSGTESWFNG